MSRLSVLISAFACGGSVSACATAPEPPFGQAAAHNLAVHVAAATAPQPSVSGERLAAAVAAYASGDVAELAPVVTSDVYAETP